MSAYHSWKKWAFTFSVVHLPAKALSFTLYILHKIQMGDHVSSVKSAYYGMRFIHRQCHLHDPTDERIVKKYV